MLLYSVFIYRSCFSAAGLYLLLRFLLQVIHSTSNKNVYKAQIVADYIGVKLELVDNFEFGVTNKTEEFLKLNPFGKVIIISEDLFLYSWKKSILFSNSY